MSDSLRPMRQLIWLYFWLLLFEGALRKWLLPGLSGPLLIVRDPVALGIYALAIRHGIFPRSALVWAMAILAAMCFAASFAGVGNFNVTLFGLRADFLHLPLIFILPRVLRPGDVRRLGLALLVAAPLMAALAVAQFKGGSSSRWNVGVGGEIGGQLYAAQGRVRASGTFSFATGFATYLALSAAFLLHDLLGRRIYPRWVTYPALTALVLAVVVSGSRSAVISVGIVCCMVIYMAFRKHAQFGAALRPLLLTVVVTAVLARSTPTFEEGLAVHRDRFASGGGLREGIAVRTGREYVAAWDRLFTAPLLGVGLGVGTNAGSSLLLGQREFILGEGEWERVIMESGPLLGSGYLALRLAILMAILAAVLHAYRAGRTLPLLLIGATGIDLVTGQFGQPTALGFAVFTGGLALAACIPEEIVAPQNEPPREPVAPKIAGRSTYAERLHGSGEAQPEP